jgi:hypothetical protein
VSIFKSVRSGPGLHGLELDDAALLTAGLRRLRIRSTAS